MTHSIYQNDTAAANSSRTIISMNSVVSLQANITKLITGKIIEAHWKVDVGKSTIETSYSFAIYFNYHRF